MRYKKSLIFICLIICFFSIASVCASEINETVVANEDQKVIKVTDEVTYLKESSSVGTFTDLANKINGDECEIVLDCDYVYNSINDSDYQKGIKISKTISIDGQGHTLDGNGEAKILNVRGNNVVLKNVIFTNIFSDSTQKDPAVSWYGDNGIVENCSFINISVKYGTSALTIGDNAKIINCSFINNNARTSSNTVELKGDTQVINCKFINNTCEQGGAIYSYLKNNTIMNCEFINNTASMWGGAIHFSYYSDKNIILNCSFKGNSANHKGGSIDIRGNENYLLNNLFVENVASNGGAIYWSGDDGKINNCSFINNSAFSLQGGAIFWEGDDGIINDSYFENNSASDSSGGAIFNSGNMFTLTNNSFVNNYAFYYGGAVLVSANEFILDNCTFINNSAKSGTVRVVNKGIVKNCLFYNNFALENGGAIEWKGNDGTLENCIFINNFVSSNKEGGAIYWVGNKGILTNCSFIKNSAYGGSAISIYGINCVVNTCLFENNFANGAGAIYCDAENSHISNCSFKNNYALELAGAVYIVNNNCLLKYCYFVNNSAEYGGAIFLQGNMTNLTDCYFINNTASTWAGAAYCMGNDIILNNDSFVNNVAQDLAGAIFWRSSDGLLTNSSFVDNLAYLNGSSVYWFGNNGNLIKSNFIDNNNTNQVFWWNKENGYIADCKFINNTRSVINNGAIFIRNNVNLLYTNSSFNYRAPIASSVYLKNILVDLPVKSQIIFNLIKGDNCKIFIVDLIDGVASVCDELSDLDAGVWNVTATFDGDDNYYPCDTTFSITINPIMSLLTVTGNNVTVGHETNLISNISNFINLTINEGYVTFFDGETNIGEANVTDGVATLIYTPTMAGEHIISALYHANNYANSTGSTILNVDKIDSNIIISDINLDYGGVGSTNFSIDGAIGVNASIINMSNFIVNVTGNSIFVSGLDAGNYSLIVNTVPDANHNPVSEIISVIVNKVDSSVIVEDIEFDYDSNGTSLVVLTGADSFTATVNDVNAIVSVDDDVVTVSNLTAGNYSLSVTTVPDKNHNEITKTATIIVNKIKSTLDLNNGVSFNYGETGFTNVLFTGATGVDVKVIDQSKAIINVNDEIISVSGLDGGNHVLEVTTIPDSNHVAITKQVNIMVNPISANLTATISNIEFGNNAIVNIEINKEITGKVMIDNNEVVIVDGIGSYTINKPNAGNHTVGVMFEGDNNFLADTKIVSFEVTKKSVPAGQNPFTPAKTDDQKQSNNLGYTITLNEDAKGNLTVTIGDKTFTKELINGTATVEVNGIPAGDYVATITYTGDENNDPITRVVNATVKVDPVITASNANVVYSAGSYYTITVYGTDGKPANGVTVKISGKISKTLTTTNGIAKFKVTQVPETYKITITALDISITKTITVKHLVILKTITIKKSAKKLTLQATLAKVNGKYINKKTVTFKFNGKKYTAKTDKKGVAKVTVKSDVLKKLKVGKKVTYQATYLKDTVKKTAKIKK